MLWEKDGLRFEVRMETTDWNTVQACVGEDEYGLADVNMYRKLVFDVGAHIGSVGIWCAKRGARAVCVEPVPPNVELIRTNAWLNGVSDHVAVVETVAGRLQEVRTIRWGFAQDKTARAHAYIGDSGRAAPDVPFESKPAVAVTFHELVAEHGEPDIVKLDCEGGEWAWLEETPGMASVPLIVGEWHPTEGHTLRDLRAALDRTHELTVTGPEAGPGGFRAELREQPLHVISEITNITVAVV
jgi:FkbM family methyltransferase